MKDENVKYLEENFPLWFSGWCWDFADGWFQIAKDLCEEIRQILYEEEVPEVEYQVGQTKEKFGGLRWYDNTYDLENSAAARRINAAVEAACTASYHTCEICGEPGKVRPLGWVMTLCDDHYSQRLQELRSRRRPGAPPLP